MLNISKTGLKAIQNKIDGLADNLSNLETHGYKEREVVFEELLTNEIYDSDVLKSGTINHSRINAGTKSKVGTIDFQQGTILPSTGDFHMAIEGQGFFGVYDRNGNLILTRNGGFHINEDNSISDDNGNMLSLNLYLPLEDWGKGEIAIANNGEIRSILDGESQILGQVILYSPQVLDSLTSLGEGGYLPSPDLPLYNSLDHDIAFGTIIQYALEGSNVELSKTMSDLIIAQRAYSFNAKSLQNTDDIMSMINNIKR